MIFPVPPDRAPRVHFIGIGGTAMVAGARLALDAGWEVRGSDNPLYPPTSEMVRELSVPVAEGYDPANLDWNPDLVVVGNALSRGNPEVEAMLSRRLTYISLPEWLKEVVLRRRRPVAVCGTHGKTTTTSLLAFLLDRCGLGGGFLIGGRPLDFPHSSRLGGEGEPFVIEGDEYDTAFFDKRAKFFHYLPEIAVVTSLEFDHADIYRDVGEIERAFRLMLRQIPADGRLVLCADDPGAAALAGHAFCEVVTYGLGEGADWRGEATGESGERQEFVVYRHGRRWAGLAVPLAGEHNLRNTLAAVVVAAHLGAEPDSLRRALPEYRGVRRRMEVFLRARGLTFIDDFAHHPTAVRETIAAARRRWNGRLRVLLEPRSNTMVRKVFQEELAGALGGADEVWIGPIHRAERIPASERLQREQVAATLERKGVPAHVEDEVDAIVAGVLGEAREGDIVLILSNGSFGDMYRKFREALERNDG